jgi:hypothetical protein
MTKIALLRGDNARSAKKPQKMDVGRTRRLVPNSLVDPVNATRNDVSR